MGERYVKVFGGEENLYTENAPIIIRASALLKDTQTGKVIAQLKLQNVSDKVIAYAKASITPLDALKQPLSEAITFEYADFLASENEEFGAKKPLALPNASTRSFLVGIIGVGFADGSVWTGENTDWKATTADSAVMQAIKADATFKQALQLCQSQIIEEIVQAKALFASIADQKDVSLEVDICEKKIAELTAKQEELEKKKEEQEKKKIAGKKKRKKIIKIGSIAAAICAVLALAGYFAAYPLISYLSGDYSVYINMYGVEEFEIPDGVTSIDDYAFCDFDSLTSVIIPDGVTSIGEGAFAYCENLTNVTIPDSVTSIGDKAFYGCESLTSITLPNGVTSIGNEAFAWCESLTSIPLPDSVTSIGDFAFLRCDALTSITVPDSVTRIGKGAFSQCYSLESMTLPFVGESVSQNRYFNHLLGIRRDAYENGQNNLRTIEITGGSVIEDHAFFYLYAVQSITLPNGVTSIGDEAFYGCDALTSITIPDGVISIGDYAFGSCDSLTSITIPDSVTSIGDWAFRGCTKLESVTIGKGVKTIGSKVFDVCSSLDTIKYTGTMKQWKSITKDTDWLTSPYSYIPASKVQCSDGSIEIDP